MKKFLTRFFILLIFLTPSESLRGYKIRQFKILCYNIDETKMHFEKCEIKAKRGTGGLLNVVIHYKNLSELQANLQLFYRGTSGRYQPFLINVLMDACDLSRYKTGGEVLKLVMKVFDQFYPNYLNGCPTNGPFNITDFDFDKESQKFFPPVIAGGNFMMYFHVHDNKNQTYAEIKYFFEVKTIGLTDAISLGPSTSLKGYKIRQFKILCYNIDETKVHFERCEINAKRGTNGLLNVVLHYKGLTELQSNFQLFYRGTSGKYQPCIVNILLDACDLSRYSTGNEILRRAIRVFDQFNSNFPNGCPAVGPFNISNFDFDKESQKFYPPVIGGGTFMIYLHIHDNKNRTYAEVKYFIEVKSIGLTDMIQFG